MLTIVVAVLSGINALVSIAMALVVMPMRSMQKRLETQAGEMIDAKFSGEAAKADLKLALVNREIASINERLQRGDDGFEKIGEGKHRLELKLLAAIADVKETMLSQCAGKDELNSLRDQVNEMASRFAAMEQAVAMDIEHSRRVPR